MRRPPLPALLAASLLAAAALAEDPTLKRERFDRDPGWEAFNNRMEVKERRTVVQDFGFSAATNFAGAKAGEVGGKIARAGKLASYAARVPARTLNDRLSASGTFVFTATSPGGGLFVGWFNDRQPETARPTHSLGMNFDTEGSGARLAIRMINAENQSCGHFVTHFIPGKFRPTPLHTGQRYRWTLDYDPDGAGGNGQFTYVLTGHDPAKDPIDGRIVVDLPSGFKQTGATFTRFGIVNNRKAGGSASLFLDDLAVNGQSWDFSADPQWEGVANRASYVEDDPAGVQNFGYSATAFAGGGRGEIGGVFWRSEYASYADRVGPFGLDRPLVARGRVAFTAADPDSDAYFGWFSSGAKDEDRKTFRNFVGVAVGGPTRVGHYFAPELWTAKGEKAHVEKGPVLRPDGKVHDWTLAFDPQANGGLGVVTVTLDRETVTLNLRDKTRAQGAVLDRFGMFSSRVGGSKVKLWLDGLEYTAR